ncbi:MAG: iron-containing alcohol dehydrogenase [Ruminococcus sp.]|jgi:alcohol dehydrogenase YqhD (iron-dependent ADH family)|nr:iron-containing alcohol dehydrogenase [Ruminococcus sp.]
MDRFDFYSPTYFVFGDGRESETGAYVKKFGGSRVLLHFGSGSVIRSGLLERVSESLKKEGIPFFALGGVKPNPRDTLVYEGIELVAKENIDFIVAVGGGSAIDSAKAIALGSCYEGDFWDFWCGKAEPKKALPVATVLTIAAAGSEGSPSTVITKEEGGIKRGLTTDLVRPKFSVMNPALTETLPAYQTACGVTDIMAHVFERYFTNTKNVEMTDRLCEATLLTVINEAPKVIKNPNDYDARANIMWAGTVAHTDICGVGRSQDWNSHGLEHELSGLYDVAHGAGLAVVMPAWMEYVMNHDVMRFAQAANRIWGVSMDFEHPELTAKKGIKAFRTFLKSIGMPQNFSEIGALEADIPALVEKHPVSASGKVGGFMDLTPEDCANIYTLAAKGGTL